MILLRSSTRCSKKVICPPGSSTELVAVVATVDSGGLSVMGCVVRAGGDRRFRGEADLVVCQRGVGSSVRAWHGFRHGPGDGSFGEAGTSYRIRIGCGRLCLGTCWSALCRGLIQTWRGGCCRGVRGFLALDFAGLALQISHFLFKSAPEIGGSFAEFGQKFTQAASKLRQLLGSEDHQDDDKNDDHVRNTKHGAK